MRPKNLVAKTLKPERRPLRSRKQEKPLLRLRQKIPRQRAHFDIKVNQLAKGSRLESADNSFADANAVVATTDGEFTFEAGDNSFTVAVTAGMTLNELRLKINESGDNFGVNANILKYGGRCGNQAGTDI